MADLRSVATELSSARVSSVAHRIAPPGFEPGIPGPRPGGIAASPRGYGRPAPIRTRTSSPRTRHACQLRHGAVFNAEDGPGTPREMASPNGRIPKPTASRTRFSVFWRHCLLAVSLSAVGTRHVPMGSAMPFASLQGTQGARPIWKFRPRLREHESRRRAREESNPDWLVRSELCCPLHHMPDAPERN